MYYIPSVPNPSGAYPGPRSNPEPGAYPLTDAQANVVVAYNGFVQITVNDDGAVDVQPNLDLWEAWKAEESANLSAAEIPAPTEVEQLRADVDYLLMLQEG